MFMHDRRMFFSNDVYTKRLINSIAVVVRAKRASLKWEGHLKLGVIILNVIFSWDELGTLPQNTQKKIRVYNIL